jgi:peroxiredoxin Q/BCP
MGEALVIEAGGSGADSLQQMLKALHVPARVERTWAAAMSVLRGSTPTVILVDSVQPGVEGFAAFRALRGETRLRAVPILIAAAPDNPETPELASKLGANTILFRPFASSVLESNLRRLGVLHGAAGHAAADPSTAVPEPESQGAATRGLVPAAGPLRAGSMAPDFDLQDETGARRRLSDLRGRPFVLYFYPADDTPGCTKEACSFRDDYAAFQQSGVTLLGVSPDTVRSHAKFREKHRLPFSLLADPDHHVCSLYGVWGPKKLMGRSYEGVLRTTFIIDKTGRIARVFEKVRPAAHSAEVLAALESL